MKFLIPRIGAKQLLKTNLNLEKSKFSPFKLSINKLL